MSARISGIRLDGTAVDISEGQAGDVRVTKRRALHANLRDDEGNELGTSGNPIFTSGGGGASGGLTDEELRAAPVPVIDGLSIPEHDYIGLSYTGSNLTTVVYKTGGAGGSTVATLTLAYTGSQLDSVTKS
jgi:hypothetical protein